MRHLTELHIAATALSLAALLGAGPAAAQTSTTTPQDTATTTITEQSATTTPIVATSTPAADATSTAPTAVPAPAPKPKPLPTVEPTTPPAQATSTAATSSEAITWPRSGGGSGTSVYTEGVLTPTQSRNLLLIALAAGLVGLALAQGSLVERLVASPTNFSRRVPIRASHVEA